MDALLEKWSSKKKRHLELWRHDDHWSIYQYTHFNKPYQTVPNLCSYEEARARLDIMVKTSDYKKVFDISTVEKQIEFQVLKDGKYVAIDARDLLRDLE